MVTGRDKDEVWTVMRTRRRCEVQSNEGNDESVYFKWDILTRSDKFKYYLGYSKEGGLTNWYHSVIFRAFFGLLAHPYTSADIEGLSKNPVVGEIGGRGRIFP